MTERLWVLGALISKQEPGMMLHNIVACYRIAATEDEARGSFFVGAQAEKPGFAVNEIVCVEIPADAMRRALGIEEAENA